LPLPIFNFLHGQIISARSRKSNFLFHPCERISILFLFFHSLRPKSGWDSDVNVAGKETHKQEHHTKKKWQYIIYTVGGAPCGYGGLCSV
jgi:hypothetical protein